MKTNNEKRRLLIAITGSLMFILSLSLEFKTDETSAQAGFIPCNTQKSLPNLKVHGVKIFVDNLKAAEEFYGSFLGLQIEQRSNKSIALKTEQYPLYLMQAESHVPRNVIAESHYGISFLTSKLLPAIDDAREFNVYLYDTLLSRNGIGIHIPISDPSGNLLHLMEVQVRKTPRFDGFKLYNSGTTTHDMLSAEEFYSQTLGFQDWSRDYLPDALPLKDADGNFAFMLHQDKNLKPSSYTYGNSPGVVLMLQTQKLELWASYLASENIAHEIRGGMILITDSHNNTIEVIEGP